MSAMSLRAPVTPSTVTATPVTAETAAGLLEEVRTRSPLVQNITNAVVTNFTANALLALGAAPAMCDVPGEAGIFARVADGLLVNLGTPDAEQRVAALEAVAAAREAGTPWVLDPVAVGALPVRTALARELLGHGPTVVRGNASEVIALAGAGTGGRGVDSTDDPEDALAAATGLARELGCVVAVSGPTDVVTDGRRVVRISNGHPWLTRVTGGGCALGAVMAAFAGATPADDKGAALAAAVAATAAYTVAAEQAAATATGPGSFAVAFLDRLALVTPDDVRLSARIATKEAA
jgi:hydroxyethylthiazole kinase